MAELLLAGDGKARESLSHIFHALGVKGQGAIAQVMGISDSSMSRWKSDEIPVMAKFLDALGLQVTPKSYVLVDPERLRSLTYFARAELERVA